MRHPRRSVRSGSSCTGRMRGKASNILTTKLLSVGLRLWAAGCGLALVGMLVMPALYGQQDKDASLIPPASRKSAPSFELVTQVGNTMAPCVVIGERAGEILKAAYKV
jgi:hypothetical protein